MLKIAVTGHRSNRISNEAESALTAIVEHLLARLKNESRQPIQVISALAEGADRIVVEAAILVDVPFRVILPFPAADYADDFASDASKQRFLELLEFAQATDTLVFAEQRKRSDGYVAVGDALLASADVLLAIWDGEPARGHGGTADVVRQALDKRIPVLWLLPQADTPVKLLSINDETCEPMSFDNGIEVVWKILSV